MTPPTTGLAPGRAGADSGTGRLTLGERAALRAALVLGAVLRRIPEGLAYRIGSAAGTAAWLVRRRRRDLARQNLLVVCRWLAPRGLGGPRVAAAVGDQRILGGLVRDVFRHWAVTYVESAMATRWDAAELRRRVSLDDPAASAHALAPLPPGEPGRVYVSLHFGSVEVTGLYATLLGDVDVVAPMETVDGRLAAAYFERVRGRFGVDVLPAEGAAARLGEALARGASVGLVADRTIVGSGTRVELFGSPCRLPASPAVLASRFGATMFVLALRREGYGRWRARVRELQPQGVPRGGGHGGAARALLEAQVAAFESFVADAPEQWWTLLFPIWDSIGGRAAA